MEKNLLKVNVHFFYFQSLQAKCVKLGEQALLNAQKRKARAAASNATNSAPMDEPEVAVIEDQVDEAEPRDAGGNTGSDTSDIDYMPGNEVDAFEVAWTPSKRRRAATKKSKRPAKRAKVSQVFLQLIFHT